MFCTGIAFTASLVLAFELLVRIWLDCLFPPLLWRFIRPCGLEEFWHCPRIFGWPTLCTDILFCLVYSIYLCHCNEAMPLASKTSGNLGEERAGSLGRCFLSNNHHHRKVPGSGRGYECALYWRMAPMKSFNQREAKTSGSGRGRSEKLNKEQSWHGSTEDGRGSGADVRRVVLGRKVRCARM